MVFKFHRIYRLVLLRLLSLCSSTEFCYNDRPFPAQPYTNPLPPGSILAVKNDTSRGLCTVLPCYFRRLLARRSIDIAGVDLLRRGVFLLLLHLRRRLVARLLSVSPSWSDVLRLAADCLASSADAIALLVSFCSMSETVSWYEAPLSSSSQRRQVCQWLLCDPDELCPASNCHSLPTQSESKSLPVPLDHLFVYRFNIQMHLGPENGLGFLREECGRE